MNVVIDFLLEYYVWVLVVLVILLITVIGFLVDTKRKKKLREKADNMNPNTNMGNANYPDYNNMGQGLNMEMNNGYPDYNNMNMGMNNFNMNNVNNMNAMNGMGQMDSMVNNMAPDNMMANGMNIMDSVNPMNNMNVNMMNNANNMVNPDVNLVNQPNNNMVNPDANLVSQPNNNMLNSNMDNSSDTFFVPASEQTPKFAPRNVVIPKPVESTPIVNNMGTAPSPVIEPTPVNTESVGMENPAGINFVGAPTVNDQAPFGNAHMNATPVSNLAGAMPNSNMVNNMNTMAGNVGAPTANAIPNAMPSASPSVPPVPPVMPSVTPSVAPMVNQEPAPSVQTPLTTPNLGGLNNPANPGIQNQGVNNINS